MTNSLFNPTEHFESERNSSYLEDDNSVLYPLYWIVLP